MNELNNRQKNKLEENACNVSTTYTQRNSKDMIVMKRFHFTDPKELLGSWLALDSLRGVNDNLLRVDGFNVTLDISDLCITENSQMSIHAYYHDVLCDDTTYDCGCINHGDDENVGCQSCEYVSCLDCHHINSQSINSNEWVCYEGYGCKKDGDA